MTPEEIKEAEEFANRIVEEDPKKLDIPAEVVLPETEPEDDGA